MTDYTIGDTFDVKFTTRQFSTGAPFTLAGTPAVAAYPDNSTTQITAGITLSVDFDSVTGLNNVRVVATAGNGYAAGSTYHLVITAGTVDGVSVVGEVVGSFTLGRAAAAVDLANGTDGLGALKTLLDTIAGYIDTEIAAILVDTGTTLDAKIDTVDTVVDAIKAVTDNLPDSGALSSLAQGSALATVDTVVDAIKVVSDALTTAGAAKLAAAMLGVVTGTVEDTTTTPTTTVFAAADITEATADHYIGRIVTFTSGALLGQSTDITDYELAGGEGKFTVTALTEAPADGDTFVIT